MTTDKDKDTMTVTYVNPKGEQAEVFPCTVRIDERAKTLRLEYGETHNRVAYEGAQNPGDPIGVFRLRAVQIEEGGEGRLSWISASSLTGDWDFAGQRGLWRVDLGD